MFIKLLIISIILVAIVMLALGIKLWFDPNAGINYPKSKVTTEKVMYEYFGGFDMSNHSFS